MLNELFPYQHRPRAAERPQWEEDEDVLVDEDVESAEPAHIVVWNDEVNTFDWVIYCFMDVLSHTYEQADQLALMIHTRGKAIVKTGPRKELEPMCEALQERGLSAEMQGGK